MIHITRGATNYIYTTLNRLDYLINELLLARVVDKIQQLTIIKTFDTNNITIRALSQNN